MKKFYINLLFALIAANLATAQNPFTFDPSINPDYTTTTVVLPPSPLKYQVLFVGSVDMVQTTATYGNPATAVPAKEWHDFIGFTPDNNSSDLGWVIVNHEMIQGNDNIGDGGGMTVFKVTRDANTDTLVIVNQTLADGRTGKFFNVDFVNTVGETGMNCSGISSPDGRIWTAEEWWIPNNEYIAAAFRDTSDYTIQNSGISMADGQTIKRYENLNWMVEVDPKQAKAIRKQYNWGRGAYEGGVILSDNRTVFLGEDNTPGFLVKFVANTPGDFTDGKFYVYKHDNFNKWVEIDNTNLNNMLNYQSLAIQAGATMFNRLEWVTYDPQTDAIYMTETGRDNPGSRFAAGLALGGVLAPHHAVRATVQGTTATSSNYTDYYGRVLKLDLTSNVITTFLEAGPFFPQDSVSSSMYPASGKHLSNPDGINVARINGKSFLIISEDLNGTSHGRVPEDLTAGAICELFLLDMTTPTPTIDDLIRISVAPKGAEITGAIMTPDGKTLLVNAQHPSSSNPYPYNHSLTYAITGWDNIVVTSTNPQFEENDPFAIFPNPTTRELHLNEVTDVAIYNAQGQRIKVVRNTNFVDVSELVSGVYFIRNARGITKRLVIQK